MGERVGGVRVSPKKVATQKPVITPSNVKLWNSAKTAYLKYGNFDNVLKRADISEENQSKIIHELSNV